MTDAAAPVEPVASETGRRALGDIVVQVVGRLANGLLGVVVLSIIARLLGAGDFGRWSTLLAVLGLAGPLTELGISQVAIARAAADPPREASWLGALFAVRSVLALIAASLCFGTIIVLGDTASMHVAGALLAGTVLLAGFSSLQSVFQLRMRNDVTILVVTVNSVVWTAAVVVIRLAGGGLVALAIAFLGAAVVSTALQTVLALRRTRVTFAAWRGRGRELVRVGLPLSIGTLLVLAYGRVDQLLVFSIAGERDAGLYGAAYRILDQAIVIPLSVTTTLYPLLVRAQVADPARVRRVLQHALEVLVAVGLGALAFAIPCGGDALALLLGDEYRAAGGALAILMGVFLLISVNYLNGSVVLIFGLQKRVLLFAAAGLACNLALNLALLPTYGYVAAAWATLATEGLVVVLTGRATMRVMAWRPDVTVLARAVLAATIVAVALAGAQGAGIPIEVLLAATPVGYGALLVLLGGLRMTETIELVRPGARG